MTTIAVTPRALESRNSHTRGTSVETWVTKTWAAGWAARRSGEEVNVTRARTARRIATAAAYGGGGVTLLGIGLYGLLMAEAVHARSVIKPLADGDPPPCSGHFQPTGGGSGVPITFAMIGDSTAAGYGVDDAAETPGAVLAAGLAEVTGRPVELACPAVVGAESSDLAAQLDALLAVHRPQVAAVIIGGNDVTHRVPAATAVRHLADAIRRLRAVGTEVVIGTCPDLGTIEPLRQPLRWLARLESRRLAAAQAIAAVEAGARAVSLGDLLGPEFAAAPDRMFSADRFHPSAFGYRAAADVLLPSLADAIGYGTEPANQPEDGRERNADVLPLPLAAVEAADEAGTEICGSDAVGNTHGKSDGTAERGDRLARMRRRIRRLPILFGSVPGSDPGPERERIDLSDHAASDQDLSSHTRPDHEQIDAEIVPVGGSTH